MTLAGKTVALAVSGSIAAYKSVEVARLCLKAGARGPLHTHGADEHAYVISGSVDIGGHILGAGDYLFTAAGEQHALVCLEDSVLYASTERPIEVIEQQQTAA